MSTKLTELRGKLDERRGKMHEVFEQAGDDLDFAKVTAIEGDTAAKAAQVKAWNDEMTDLGKEIADVEELLGIKRRNDELGEVEPHPGHPKGGKGDREREEKQTKTIGEMFIESTAFKGRMSRQMGSPAELDIEAKTLFQTSAGWAPVTFRGPQVVDYPTRPIRVVDLIPQTTTQAAAISYMEETTFTNNAAEVSEAGLKPEAALALTERTDTVRKIGVWLPVTDEQLEDIPRIRDYLNNRLGFMVRQRLDLQILVGDGTPPNISGIQDRTGVQTQAKGGDPVPDAIYKAMQKVRVNAFAEPTGVVLHPNDWTPIRLLATADGIYIWGPPMDPGPERIWGLQVVQTTAQTENTGLVGDFNQTELAVKKGVTLSVTDSHADYFIYNKQVILAEMRAALAVYVPAAFCQVTGI